MKLLIGILFLCYPLLVVLTGSAMYRRHYQSYTIMKTLASTGFLLIGAGDLADKRAGNLSGASACLSVLLHRRCAAGIEQRDR